MSSSEKLAVHPEMIGTAKILLSGSLQVTPVFCRETAKWIKKKKKSINILLYYVQAGRKIKQSFSLCCARSEGFW